MSCPVCLPLIALDQAAALALAAPELAILLTGATGDWPTTRAQMQAFRRALTRAGVQSETAYQVEINPAGTGHHIHAWHHGSALDTSLLREAATRSHFGPVALCRPAFVPTPSAGQPPRISYAFKEVLDDCDGEEVGPVAKGYLAANGGKLISSSAAFWRDAEGAPIPRVRDAVRAARESAPATRSWQYASPTD